MSAKFDYDKFRLRNFVDKLIAAGEVEVHDEPVPLSDVAGRLNGNSKAVLFRKAGPEGAQLVGGVLGSRRRAALAFGVENEREVFRELLRRLERPQPGIEGPSSPPPLHPHTLT